MPLLSEEQAVSGVACVSRPTATDDPFVRLLNSLIRLRSAFSVTHAVSSIIIVKIVVVIHTEAGAAAAAAAAAIRRHQTLRRGRGGALTDSGRRPIPNFEDTFQVRRVQFLEVIRDK